MLHTFLSFYEYKTSSFMKDNFLILYVIIEQISASCDNYKTKNTSQSQVRGKERRRNKKHCKPAKVFAVIPNTYQKRNTQIMLLFLENKKGEKFRLKNYTQKKTRQGKCKKVVVPYPPSSPQ